MRIVTSASAADRLAAARAFLSGRPPATEVIVVGASRGAADDLTRAIARQAGATFGITRFSLTELAARAAALAAEGTRRVPGTQAGAEAIAARAVFDALAADELEYFEPVARMPGFPKALARTLHELRLAGVRPGEPRTTNAEPRTTNAEPRTTNAEPRTTNDLFLLLSRVESELARGSVDDRAALFTLAASACRAGLVRWAARPILLLDVPLDSRAEQTFAAALIAQSSDVLATVPDGDVFAADALRALGGENVECGIRNSELADTDLSRLRRYVFSAERPPERERTGDVVLFSAPGEGREAVEIVRRVLDEAGRGVPFDEMAVFLRTPQQYLGLLEHACARGGVPVYFDRGTRRPDPAGRAFVALLSCAVDGLSAKRFDEYLSLGQVPQVVDAGAPGVVTPADEVFADEERRGGSLSPHDPLADPSTPADELRAGPSTLIDKLRAGPSTPIDELRAGPSTPIDELRAGPSTAIDELRAGPSTAIDELRAGPSTAIDELRTGPSTSIDALRARPQPEPIDSDDEAVIAGTLRSPWKWEELIVESAVVGGRTRGDGKARWRRRLDGLAADFTLRIAELKKEEPESARIARFERDLRNLAHLRQFALPIVDALAEWPDAATWGEWIERFSALARRGLRRPGRVLQTLADLRPMADVGPVTLEEARDVLHDRLVTLDWEPPARRYGRLFVGTPHQARGRAFRVVFVPGLAERVVPQRPREDPLLLDEGRRALDPALVGQDERGAAERLLLKIAIGAASERLYLSYPRLDVSETRARVPSFYALDVVRAITGRVPDHRVLASAAAEAGGASLAWPAPKDPDRAIDDLEHDLATLKPLLDSRDPASVKGHAHYLLGLNEALRRSVISRWARGRGAWSPADGLIRIAPNTESALAAQRLRERPYSLSALQRFAACPYQFLLATIYRLEPWDEPEPLVRMDPLTRGSLFHKAQAEFYRALQQAGALPVTRETLAPAAKTLDAVLDRVAGEYAEMLAPAIDRVWRDEIDELRRDLGIWVQKIAGEKEWQPAYFEFSFGLNDEGRDPRSLPDPILVDGRFVLRGSVDLVEHRADFDLLRITDHKTGKNRSNPDLVVGGGATLQPVLYSLAVEQGLGKKVFSGRLFYATTAGGFVEHEIPINDYTRRQGLQVLEIVDRAIETGFLPAKPSERACTWCDFRPVCGPREEERTRRKAKDRLADLDALRSMR